MQYGTIDSAISEQSSLAENERLVASKVLRISSLVCIVVISLAGAAFGSEGRSTYLRLPSIEMSSIFKPVDKFSSHDWKIYGDLTKRKEKDEKRLVDVENDK